MDPEDENKQGKEPEEGQQAAGAEDEGAQGKEPEDGVKDKHGQPGINKERHDKEVAELKAEIEKLKGEAAEAAENKAKRDEYEKKFSELEAKMADSETTHKLELAGCVDVKAAKARLADFDNDVDKLAKECPYLFGEKKQTGSTGKKPAGASGDLDEKLDRAFGLKK